MASLIDKLTNVLMTEEEETDVKVKDAREVRPFTKQKNAAHERPVLTVHTNKVPELKVMVYTPTSFDQANIIANALRNKEAVIVNYEEVDSAEQRRLCDFVNGVCYILDGGVQRISDKIVLYVPVNVDIRKELCAYAVPAYMKYQSQ